MRLKELRIQRGLSQQELARALNISQQSIYKYENNLTMPTISTLIAMSKFFDISIDALLSAPYKQPPISDLSWEEYYLLYDYRKLNKANRELIRKVISRLLGEKDFI